MYKVKHLLHRTALTLLCCPRKIASLTLPTAPSTMTKSPAADLNGIDWLAQQNGGQFDPVLFGDYRDPQDNIMNTNLGDFFNDAFLTQDFSTPFNTGELTLSPQPAPPQQPTAPAKPDPIKQCEAAQNANDDPSARFKHFLSCDKVWLVFPSTNFSILVHH